MKNKKIAIIGGGASGMMAAIAAAKNKNDITIFEKNSSLGKKILLTGNGRCNITNVNVSYKNYFGQNPKFTASVFARFSNTDTISFFEKLGLVLKEEDRGRLFPRSDQAASIIEVLEYELEKLNIEIKLNQKIKSIEKQNQKFKITTFQGKEYIFDKVIIATGGRSYPKTGSTGDGYKFAQSLGHKIIEPFQASVPLRIKHIVCNKLQGIKVVAGFKILQNQKTIFEITDEVLFTHFGLSAPAVLNASRVVSEILNQNKEAKLVCEIDFFPEYNIQELYEMMMDKLKNYPEKKITNQFIGMLPKKLAPVVLSYSGINTEQESRHVSKQELRKILELLKTFQMLILDTLGWDFAQFTAGGVDVKEIDSGTMESKLLPGLYFAGEVVDIDGQSGGYNLQWAWSSGYVAGHSFNSSKVKLLD